MQRQSEMPVMNIVTASCRILVISLILVVACLGQIKSGTIVGTVTDTSGAVVPDARIAVVNQQTNVSTGTITGKDGTFTVPYLEPGSYTVNIDKPGSDFAKYSTVNVTVLTAQTVKIDAVLKVGATGQVVTVSGEVATLQTDNAAVEGSVNALTVQSIPNITHNAFAYAALQPGVVPRGAFNDTQGTTSFGIGIDGRRQASAIGINGGPAFSNDIILDGVSIQGSAWNESAVLPNQDSLQEVKTITNNYSAEYGRAQGVVIFTTKSGGNDFHGSALYRLRNEALNGNSFSNNAKGIPRGPFKSNSFGGSFGGPIIRNKAFFFASYEGLLFHRAYDFLKTVPTQTERNGDFSNTYVTAGGNAVPIKIFDPFNVTQVGTSSVYNRAQFPTFTDSQGVVRTSPLPAGRLNQFGLALLNAYPLPNRPADDIFNHNNFFFRGNQNFDKNVLNSRVDYQWKKNYFYGTYGFQRGNIETPRSWGPANQYYSPNEFVGNQQPDNNYYAAIGDTIVLSPTLVLDARLGVNRIQSDDVSDSFSNYNYDQFGIPQAIQALNVIPGVPPNFAPSGTVSGLNNTSSLHKHERQTNTDANGSITWIHGRWTHKFGGAYRVLLSNYIDVDNSVSIATSPDFTRSNINANGTTNGLTTPDPTYNGLSMASILLGAGNLTVTPPFALRLAIAQKYYGIYSQNDWHVNDKFTLNLGLRWDVQPGPTERHNRLSAIDLDGTEPLFGTPGAIVFPGRTISRRNMWQTQYNNFSPRFGAAYQVRRSLVIRGGFGVSYVPSNTGFNDGPGFYGAQPFTPAVIGQPYGTSPAGKVIAPFNDPSVNPITAPFGADPTNPGIYGGARRFPDDYKNGYVQQWNLFVEQTIGKNWIVSAGYLGSRGRNLQVAFIPLNSAQLVDPNLLVNWRGTYITSNGKTNPSTQPICNPFQNLQTCVSNPDGTFKSATGPLVPYGTGNIRNRSISRLEAAFPYPLEGDNITLSSGISDYNALQLQATHLFASGLQLSGSYTFSKQMAADRYNAQTNQGYSDGGNVNYYPYLQPQQRRLNRQITTNDVPHRATVNWVYELPVGNGKRFALHQPILNSIIGGWTAAGSFTDQSGFVVPLNGGGTNSINGLPDRVAGVPLEVPKALQRWYDGKTAVTLPSGRIITPCNGCFLKYNIDAFAGRTLTTPNGSIVPDLFWYGNAAPSYGNLRSNPIWNVNMSLQKAFTLKERYSLILSAQATNLFNHTQFKPGLNTGFGATVLPSTLLTNPTLKVGELLDTTSTFGTYTQNTYDPRQIELVARFRF